MKEEPFTIIIKHGYETLTLVASNSDVTTDQAVEMARKALKGMGFTNVDDYFI